MTEITPEVGPLDILSRHEDGYYMMERFILSTEDPDKVIGIALRAEEQNIDPAYIAMIVVRGLAKNLSEQTSPDGYTYH